MTWCGYIDILGTREAALHSVYEVRKLLDDFHSALFDHFDTFSGGECIAFSDGAFFRCAEFDDFPNFYFRVRNQLFERGIFFKCSYLSGDIKIEDRETDDDGKYSSIEPPKFRSFNFSEDAAKAYQAESGLRGSGCTVILNKTNSKKEYLFDNFCIRRERNKISLEKFVDFKFSDYEISGADNEEISEKWTGQQKLLDRLFYYCHTNLISSDRHAEKFTSILANVIRSSDFSTAHTIDGEIVSAPYVFEKLSKRKTLKAISKLPGLRYLILSLYDHYYLSCGGDSDPIIEQEIIKMLSFKSDWCQNFGDTPTYILSIKARKALVKAFSKFRGLQN